MNIATNIATNNQEFEIADDQTGLAEIQKALNEIERLKEVELPEEEEKKVDEAEHSEDEKENDGVIDEEKQIDKVQKKLWKEQKRKYQAIAEKESFKEENEKLKQMLNESLNSGTYHYGKNAYTELERAKENKKKAIEEGNIDALLDADVSLTKAIQTINELEKWAYNNDLNKNKTTPEALSKPTTQSYYSEIEHEIASDWLENHPYLQPNSDKYKQQFASKVAEFINHLDTNLAKNNQMDTYFSEQYFQTIDKYINDLHGKVQKNTKNVEAANHIGGVRNSYAGNNGTGTNPTQIVLSADERRMCANAGITEKDWLRHKLEDLKSKGR